LRIFQQSNSSSWSNVASLVVVVSMPGGSSNGEDEGKRTVLAAQGWETYAFALYRDFSWATDICSTGRIKMEV